MSRDEASGGADEGTARRVLAIESSGSGASVALRSGAGIDQRFVEVERPDAGDMLAAVQGLLGGPAVGPLVDGPGRVDALAFGRGPGAFTSVRGTVALAHGLALGGAIPLFPVVSLEALAYRAAASVSGPVTVLALADARLGEVYAAVYDVAGSAAPVERLDPALLRPDDVRARAVEAFAGATQRVCAGPGCALHARALGLEALEPHATLPDVVPDAAAVAGVATARLEAGARAVAPEDAQPLYLRDRVAEVPARLRGRVI